MGQQRFKTSRRLLFAILFALIAGPSAIAMEWHGIVPLHSTKEDVLRLLGKPNSNFDRYLIDGEEATILYSAGPCSDGGWNVPRGTVFLISVTFKRARNLSDLKIDMDKYVRTVDPFVTTHVYYTNKEQGVRYEVYDGVNEKGEVLQVYYEPTGADAIRLRCPQQ